MFLTSLLCVNLVLASADQFTLDKSVNIVQESNGHCDKQDICSVEHEKNNLNEKKLLFYDVNPPEGFNLRRDVYMRFAILLSEAKKGELMSENWVLVLPPWRNIYHWKMDPHNDRPKQWSMFFDVTTLSSYVPVVELLNVMHDSGKYGHRIDTLYVLQNYDEPFENGVFKEKWNVVGPCKYQGSYWGYHTLTANQVICVQFQGSISQIWGIIGLYPKDKSVMFAHAEIPLHMSYGTKTYWDCRKSMKFNQHLTVTAELFIANKLACREIKCSNYLAVHWRQQDFKHSNRSTSPKGTAKQIIETIKNKSLAIQDIFVATDGKWSELEPLVVELENIGYRPHWYVPDIMPKYSDGQIAIIEQIICSHSAYFIGTHESTYTYRIQEEREILGFDSDTTFNRLCPDDGHCEKPSRWTIVH